MPSPLHRRLLAGALLAVALAACPADSGADASGPQIVAFLNAQRAAQGLPGDIVADPVLADGCARHNRYGALNHTLGHRETPGAPGYTTQGAAAAAQSVLYRGASWTASTNPFETAPIHLAQLLSPYIDRLGAAESDGYGCATTLASTDHAPTPTDTLFTYPADGARDWRAAEIDSEGALTPGLSAGLPAGTRTGPMLYVLASGPGVRWGSTTKLLDASLSGPAGPVAIATFDRTSPRIGAYLPAGALLLPRAPLAAATRYRASVRLRVSVEDGTSREVAKAWSFSTAGGLAPLLPALGRPASPVAVTAAPVSGACTTRLRFTGVGRTARGVRQLRLSATACRATTLRITLRRGGRTALSRTARVTVGTRALTFAVPRALARGHYAVRVRMAGATLSLTQALPAAAR